MASGLEEFAAVASYELDLRTGQLVWSDELFALSLCHPDDRGTVQTATREAAERGQAEFQYRVVTPDGRVRHLLARAVLGRDETGHASKLIGLVVDLTRLRETDESSRRNEARYRTLMQANAQVVWAGPPEGGVSEIADAWVLLTGHPKSAAMGLGFLDLIPPEDFLRFRDGWSRALAEGRTFETEFRLRRADGGYLYIRSRSVPVLDQQGRVTERFGTLTDITEAREADAARRASEERFAKAFQASVLGMSLRDLETGRILDVNDAWTSLTGYARDEVIGTDLDNVQWDPDNVRYDLVEAFRAEGSIRERTGFVRRKSGETVSVLLWVEPIEVDGRSSALISLLDVSRRVKAEAALVESNDRFKRLSEAAFEGIAFTENGFVIDCNTRLAELYGFSVDELRGMHASKLVAPESFEAVKRHIESGSEARYEYLALRKDGSRFDVEVRARVLRHGDRTVRISAVRDVTDRKLAAVALHESEERFRRLSEAAWEGIAFVENGRMVDANNQLASMLGYELNELIGLPVSSLLAPGAETIVLDHMQRASPEPYEHEAQRKDGSIITVEVRGRTVPYKGQMLRMTAIRDITERKRLEAHLRQASEINTLLVSELEHEALYASITESLSRVVKLDYASLALYDRHSKELRLQAQTFYDGRGVLDSNRLLLPEHTPAAVALQRGTVTVFNKADLDGFGEATAPLAAAGLQSMCSVPLTSRRGSLGTLNVASRTAEAFSADDVALLVQLSTYVAIAIDNAQTYEDIKELKDQLAEEKLYLEEEIRVDHNFADIIGDSPAIKRVLQQIETVARTEATVLLLGETGTGKELLARALHQLSPRKERTFVRLSGAALPSGLVESELFGYERGAFTGAIASKVGRLELAHRGTLFLDEVGDIPLELQPKLLRALQEREFERLGSSRTQRVDVRLIAATNRDLSQMVDEGSFRNDLFYRLNVFPVHVPPLRDRREDIPALVRYFAQKFSSRLKREIVSVSAASMTALQSWHWPGNIRELENVIERAAILSPGPVLQVQLPEMNLPIQTGAQPARRGTPTFVEGERELILKALRATRGVIGGPSGAAERLGMKRTTLHSKMRKLGIERPQY